MCGDSNYFQHIAACLVSLLESNPEVSFHVVLLATNSSEQSISKLKKSFDASANIELEVFHFDSALLAPLPTTSYYPREIYVRLWVEQYFAEDVERVLYLDGDMLVIGSIESLLTMDMGSHLLAAVPIPGSNKPEIFNYDPKYGYFNSGVMVLNLPIWRQVSAKEKLIAMAHHMGERITDPDQDVLNICFHAQYIPLDYVWNAISPFFKEVNNLAMSRQEIVRVVRDARIVHFNGGAKPWHYVCFHPYAKKYLSCVAKTEWRNFKPNDYNFLNIIKKRVISFLGERRSASISAFARKSFLKN
jgi:lipopolysaccharide biosynthesis glycosyltransferase